MPKKSYALSTWWTEMDADRTVSTVPYAGVHEFCGVGPLVTINRSSTCARKVQTTRASVRRNFGVGKVGKTAAGPRDSHWKMINGTSRAVAGWAPD